MQFAPMSELLQTASKGGYAIPSFCIWNAETIHTVLRVAEDLQAPVIIMTTSDVFGVMEPLHLAEVATLAARHYTVPSALLLDHGGSLEAVQKCLDVGFTSVMLDHSTRPFDENVASLREAVRMAKPFGASVEGEIGHVGRADKMTIEGEGDSTLTTPEQAAAYVEQTGVDALAVSIGNAHGQYTQLPRFDFDRLALLREAAGVPLVLHGGSGTPDADLKRAVALGMAKVNVATELVTVMRETLQEQYHEGRRPWPPIAHAASIRAMEPAIARWFERTGAAGKA